MALALEAAQRSLALSATRRARAPPARSELRRDGRCGGSRPCARGPRAPDRSLGRESAKNRQSWRQHRKDTKKKRRGGTCWDGRGGFRVLGRGRHLCAFSCVDAGPPGGCGAFTPRDGRGERAHSRPARPCCLRGDTGDCGVPPRPAAPQLTEPHGPCASDFTAASGFSGLNDTVRKHGAREDQDSLAGLGHHTCHLPRYGRHGIRQQASAPEAPWP